MFHRVGYFIFFSNIASGELLMQMIRFQCSVQLRYLLLARASITFEPLVGAFNIFL